MPVHDVSILFLLSLVAFVNGCILAWAARIGATRTPAMLFSAGSLLLAITPLTILVAVEMGSPWRAIGLNLLPLASYTCWLLGTLHFCGRPDHTRTVLLIVAVPFLLLLWLSWVPALRDARLFIATFSFAVLRAATAIVLIHYRHKLNKTVAWFFALLLLSEATVMLLRSMMALTGELPSIGADLKFSTTFTWLTILLSTVLSTPLLMLLGLSQLIGDLGRSNLRLQATLNALPDKVFELDANGCFSAFHTHQPELLPAAPEQLLGRPPEQVLPAEWASAIRAAMAEVDKHGRTFGVQYQRQLSDGPHWFEISAATRPAMNSDHAPGYVLVTRDISERVRGEQMKREFVSVISHELRTPLTSIAGALDLIVSGAAGALPASVQRLLDIARSNGQRLRLLIDDLLDMDKLSAGKMRFDIQSHPLQPLLESALDNNRTFGVEKQISLQLIGPVPAVNVAVDSQRFAQVLSNLLSNAIKFSPSGAAVEVSCTLNGDRLQVSVRDHGVGVPESFRQRLFEKFSQADGSDSRKQRGSGLGLAIVREMIERMGGSVGYEPAAGGGSCFFLDLVVAPAPATESQRQQVSPEGNH